MPGAFAIARIKKVGSLDVARIINIGWPVESDVEKHAALEEEGLVKGKISFDEERGWEFKPSHSDNTYRVEMAPTLMTLGYLSRSHYGLARDLVNLKPDSLVNGAQVARMLSTPEKGKQNTR